MAPPLAIGQPRRYLALDVMRGLTLVLMIVVNMAISPELSYAQLLHSTWNGFTLADAIYPCFLFVVGCAMALSFGREAALRPRFGRILRRSALLIACGIFVSNFPFGRFATEGVWVWQAASDVRLPGVLQRIGLAYFLGATVLRLGGPRGAVAWIVVTLPLSWWLALQFGDLTLGGSAVLKMDSAVFGLSHLYRGEGRPFDPEGLLGTLPATANLLAGYLALHYIRHTGNLAKALRIAMLMGMGLAMVALLWEGLLPINKKLWTGSYALLNIGLDTALLASLVWLVDLKGMTMGTGWLTAFGRNSLALYVLAEVLMSLAWTLPLGRQSVFMAIFNGPFAGQVTERLGSLAFGLVLVALCWLIGWWLDIKRFYIRL